MNRRSPQELARDSAQRAARHMELAARAERPWIKALDSMSVKLVEIVDTHSNDLSEEQRERLIDAQMVIDAVYTQLVRPAAKAAASESKPATTMFDQERAL